MPLLALVVLPSLVSSPPQAPTASLVFLCHRRQDLVAVAAATEGVANLIDADTLVQGWSEDWYVTPDRPAGYKPLSAVEWHARVDHAPLSVDRAQAGYQPTVISVGIGDRRRTPEIRTRVSTDWWPIYVDGARDRADALSKAKVRWVDAIYSAGRPMTVDEWIAYTGYREAKPAWFDPKPLPWAGLKAVGEYRTTSWRSLPVPVVAPYDAAIKVAPMSRRDEVDPPPSR